MTPAIRSSTRPTSTIIGDPNPDWTGSLRTNVRVKGLRIGALLDVRHGGLNNNGTKGALNHFGTSLESQIRRDGGNVRVRRQLFRE